MFYPSPSPSPSPIPAGLPGLGSPWRRHLAALAAGALSVAGFAPLAWFWLPALTLALLFLLLRSAPSARQAALNGWAFGCGLFLTGVSWVYVSLSVFGGMPAWLAGLAALLFCLFLALYPALAAYLFRRWLPAAGWRQALLFAGLLATVDWLRGWIFTGFPWLALGYSQTPPSPLAGYAPLLGVYGLSLLLALCAALLTLRRGPLLLALLLAGGAGLRQVEWSEAAGPPLSVALLQGNVAQEMKFRPERFAETLNLYTQLTADHPAQLTLLPETAIPAFIDYVPPEYLEQFGQLARRQQGDLIVGSISGDRSDYRNSAISFGSSPTQIYSKQHLVPFGEFIPAGFAWFMAQANIPMSAFGRGDARQAPLQVAGTQVALNICYEDAFGEEIIAAVPQAGILANLSNTAWFGDSLAQPQHLQIARMRALESSRPMLRATNTGMTAIITPRGEVAAQLPPFTTAALRGEVQPQQGLTPYVRYGNLPALALAAACLLLALAGGRAKARPQD